MIPFLPEMLFRLLAAAARLVVGRVFTAIIPLVIALAAVAAVTIVMAGAASIAERIA